MGRSTPATGDRRLRYRPARRRGDRLGEEVVVPEWAYKLMRDLGLFFIAMAVTIFLGSVFLTPR